MNRKKFLSVIGGAGGSILLAHRVFADANNKGFSSFPFLARREQENSYWYSGHLVSLLVSSEQTNGNYSLLRVTERRGFEPPPHTHTKEDETFLILDGEVEYTAGKETFPAKAGDVVFLPKNLRHSFKILTETAETLMLLTPGGFENYFIEMSEAAVSLELPPLPQGLPDIPKLIATASKYGIRFPEK